MKGELELIGKLEKKYTTKIGMLSSDSRDVYIKLSDQCTHILKNKEGLNGLKCSTKIQKRESLFSYKSCIYNFQRKSDVNHKGIQMRWNNKTFPPLNVIRGEISPYGSKGIIRHYHYRSDPKIGPGIVTIRRITFIYHVCTTILHFYWDPKNNKAVMIIIVQIQK